MIWIMLQKNRKHWIYWEYFECTQTIFINPTNKHKIIINNLLSNLQFLDHLQDNVE